MNKNPPWLMLLLLLSNFHVSFGCESCLPKNATKPTRELAHAQLLELSHLFRTLRNDSKYSDSLKVFSGYLKALSEFRATMGQGISVKTQDLGPFYFWGPKSNPTVDHRKYWFESTRKSIIKAISVLKDNCSGEHFAVFTFSFMNGAEDLAIRLEVESDSYRYKQGLYDTVKNVLIESINNIDKNVKEKTNGRIDIYYKTP